MFLFFFPVPAPDRGRRRTVAVVVVAAFDVFVAAAAVAAVFVAVEMFALPLLSCLLLPLLVTRCGAAFLFLILPSAACAGPCTSAREEGKARFGYPLRYGA